jgi:hypothetical protein
LTISLIDRNALDYRMRSKEPMRYSGSKSLLLIWAPLLARSCHMISTSLYFFLLHLHFISRSRQMHKPCFITWKFMAIKMNISQKRPLIWIVRLELFNTFQQTSVSDPIPSWTPTKYACHRFLLFYRVLVTTVVLLLLPTT